MIQYKTIDSTEHVQISGYDDGKEFVRTQDLTLNYFKLLVSNYHISGFLKTNHLNLYKGSNVFKFELEEANKDGYYFTSTLGDVILEKDLKRLVITNRRADKGGNELIYMMVFGKAL